MIRLLCFVLLILSFQAYAQEKWAVRVYYENGDLVADNDEPMPMSVRLDLKLTNLQSTFPSGQIAVIPAKVKKHFISKLTPKQAGVSNGFSFTATYNFGDALQQKHDDTVYALPYEKGRTQSVFQGYNGKFSHQQTRALDLNLKEGDKVLAARGGIVIEAVDHHNKACPNISCAKYNNRIVILHSDGTFAEYVHLQSGGALVKKGDDVAQNQIIGRSGNTGFSSGPHLHFGVFLNRIDGTRHYIPTKFKTSNSDAELLTEGKSYLKND